MFNIKFAQVLAVIIVLVPTSDPTPDRKLTPKNAHIACTSSCKSLNPLELPDAKTVFPALLVLTPAPPWPQP